jgi:hypothetical protein
MSLAPSRPPIFRKFAEKWGGGGKTFEDKDCIKGRTWAECVGEVGVEEEDIWAVEEGQTGGWRIVYIEEIRNFYCSPDTASVENKRLGACSSCG